jgi:crossover junction endodeoxyribonuclease RuvC
MRALGIDPGTATLGWGVVEDDGSGGVRLVDYGVITTSKDLPLGERLRLLFDGVNDILARYRPDTAGVEELFFSRNVSTAISVSHARGVVLLSLARAGIPVEEYRPMAVKLGVTGYGHADKAQIQEMVRLQLGLERIPKPDDAADALAIAICHIFAGSTLSRYRGEEQ